MERIVFVFICLTVGWQQSVSAQRPAFGNCPKIPTAKDVKVDKFLGKWYEVERSFYFYELPTSCTTMDISRPDNKTKELDVDITTYNRWTGRPSLITGKATPKGDGSAVLDYKINSKLPLALARLLPGAGRYEVLATDHDTYAVIYSCSNLGFFHADLIWVFGRKPEIPVFARAKAYDALNMAGFNTDHLTASKKKSCPGF